jgi:hypothetical protein
MNAFVQHKLVYKKTRAIAMGILLLTALLISEISAGAFGAIDKKPGGGFLRDWFPREPPPDFGGLILKIDSGRV